MSRPVIIVAHGWPDRTSGYGIATNCSIAALRQKYENISYVGVTEILPDINLQITFPNIQFIQYSIIRPSLLKRFIFSLFSKFPACVQQFRKKSLYFKLLKLCNEKKMVSGIAPVVIFEGIPVAIFQSFLKKHYIGIKTVVRSHDVLFEAFSNFCKHGNIIKRLAWSFEVKKLKIFENKTLKMANLIWPITSRDADIYKNALGVCSHGVLGVYIDIPQKLVKSKINYSTIICIVTIDYRKKTGLQEFIEEAWPKIRFKIPKAQLMLGGRNTEVYDNPSAGIRGLGFVSDTSPLLEKGFIFLNSQDSGSGVKLKSLVAMASGKLLVTTNVGVQGIEGTHGQHFLCSDKSGDLAQMIIDAMENPEEKNNIIENGYEFVKKYYTKEVFLRNTLPLIESL